MRPYTPFLPFLLPDGRCLGTGFLALFCCVLFCGQAWCQDIITRTDSVRIEADIVEVKSNQIRYRRYGNTDSSVYIISPMDVLLIKFADGSQRNFTQQATPRQAAYQPDYAVDWGRNIISLYIVDLFFQSFTFSYERVSASGKVGVKVPLSLGTDPREEGYDYSKRDEIFSVGLAIHIYPFGQGRFSYYAGPQVELASANYYVYNYDYNDPYASPQQVKNTIKIYSLELKNGVYYQFSRSFLAALDLGVGVRGWSKLEHEGDYYPFYIDRFYVPVNLQVGFRF